MNKLNIAIPTYNKPIVLLENIKEMNTFFRANNIDIYIYDDSSDEKTMSAIKQLKIDQTYNNINYKKTSIDQGHDENIMRCLHETPGDYIYLLGDGIKIDQDAFEKIIEIISTNNPDAIILQNDKNTSIDTYNDFNEVYQKFGWVVTLTGSTIYRKDILVNIDEVYSKYGGLLFLQWAILFESISRRKIDVKVIKGNYITQNNKKGDSFALSSYIEVFCKNWSTINFLLPSDYLNKEKVIKSFDQNTPFLSKTSSLIKLRSLNYINFGKYKSNREACNICITHRYKFLFFIFFPRIIAKLIMVVGLKSIELKNG